MIFDNTPRYELHIKYKTTKEFRDHLCVIYDWAEKHGIGLYNDYTTYYVSNCTRKVSFTEKKFLTMFLLKFNDYECICLPQGSSATHDKI